MKVLTILGILILVSQPVYAADETLDDILDSVVIKGIEQDNKRGSSKVNRDKWLDKGTNYARLFTARVPEMLHDWLGHENHTFRVSKFTSDVGTEFAYARRIYESSGKKELKLMILVPHPRYKELGSKNHIEVFQKLEPPKLKVKYSEAFSVQNIDGQVHYHDDEFLTCSILLKYTKSSRINLSGPCTELDDMKSLMQVLSYQRFKEKLNT